MCLNVAGQGKGLIMSVETKQTNKEHSTSEKAT